ncbi:MAG TPA: hypothetical protein VFW28_17105 [Micropepsaceae bacterium]|nr:hypothetical protein [Micropepsaceae bacterium]
MVPNAGGGPGVPVSAEVEYAVERVSSSPQQFPVVFRTVRRARLRRFPYSLFFIETRNTVLVIACFHSGRDPRRWQTRM